MKAVNDQNEALMPMSLARAAGVNSGKCEELYQQLCRTKWGDTNTYERICALISVLCHVADMRHSPDNIEFAKSIILGLAERAEDPLT